MYKITELPVPPHPNTRAFMLGECMVFVSCNDHWLMTIIHPNRKPIQAEIEYALNHFISPKISMIVLDMPLVRDQNAVQFIEKWALDKRNEGLI